jgi:hypothetical protein
MKKSRIILLSVFFLILIGSLSNSTYAQSNEDNGIVFIRVYEAGWVRAIRGVYVFYPDGKRDKTEITDDLDPIGNAQKIADALNKVSKMGYNIISVDKYNGAGVNSNYYFVEYILKKTSAMLKP